MNMIIEMVFIAFLLICGPSISMSISSSCDENYLEGKQLVESIKFGSSLACVGKTTMQKSF